MPDTTVPEQYTLKDELPTAGEFASLREATGMDPRPKTAVERGLEHSLYGVTVVHEPTGETVGMGRLLGDGGMVYQLSDMAVHPDHQRRGLGTGIVESMLAYVERTAPPGAEINLFADVDGFYEQFGFEETRPASRGMVRFLR